MVDPSGATTGERPPLALKLAPRNQRPSLPKKADIIYMQYMQTILWLRLPPNSTPFTKAGQTYC